MAPAKIEVSGVLDAWPSPGRAWWAMAVFWLAAVLSYTDRYILSLLVDPIRVALMVSDTQVSLLQGVAFGVAYGLAGIAFGRMADTLPRRSVIAAGVILWSTATVACGLADSFSQLFAARVFVGVGEAALAPAAVSMLADYYPPQRRGVAIGIFLSGMAIGGGAAITIGGTLLEAANHHAFAAWPWIGDAAPWRTVLVLLGMPGIVVFLLLMTIREPARHSGELGESSTNLPLRAAVAIFGRSWRILLPLYLAVGVSAVGDACFQNWTPTLLMRQFALSPGAVGGQLGPLSMATGVLGALVGGWVSDRYLGPTRNATRVRAAIVAIIAGFTGTLVTLAATSNHVLVFFAAWTFCVGVCSAIGIVVLQDVLPNAVRGLGVALVSFTNIALGLGVGTTLTAILTDYVFSESGDLALSMSWVGGLSAVVIVLLLSRVRSNLLRPATN